MKYCEVSNKCPWGHPSFPCQCGYKENMKETDICYNLFITTDCGYMITISNSKEERMHEKH